MTIKFEFSNGEISSSPTILLKGSTDSLRTGIIQVVNNGNKVFPPVHFEVNNGRFIAVVHLSEGENHLCAEIYDATINGLGFPEYKHQKVHDSAKLTVQHAPQKTKPFFMCVVVGKDSHGVYDMPKYRLDRGERADLSTGIQKLKVMLRLFQAYTQEEMRRKGLSNRVFPFVEETVLHQGVFGYNVDSPTPHQEVKITVLRSPYTVAEIRDKDRTQQNPNAKDQGWTWGHALDLVRKTPEIYDYHKKSGTGVQVAAMYLDAHWDKKQDMILGHAALGGGAGDVQLAVFGSHGLHSYPSNFPQMTPSFLDNTHLSKDEVANDCNECGTSWECLNICLGAFLHEIGHALGCPHQVDGIMLRDYVRFNRGFMTREAHCLRTKSNAAVIGPDGKWDQDCHWNMQDIVRFFYHDSFSLPPDDFAKIVRTTLKPDNLPNNISPFAFKSEKGVTVAGMQFYTIELRTDGIARYAINFFPPSYGGKGLPTSVNLDYNQLAQEFKRHKPNDFREDFEVSCNSICLDWSKGNFKDYLKIDRNSFTEGDFDGRRVRGIKSDPLGRDKGKPTVAFFDVDSLYKIEVFHHHAVRGIKFFWRGSDGGHRENTNGPPKIPPRDYLREKLDKLKIGRHDGGGHGGGRGHGQCGGGSSELGVLQSTKETIDLDPDEKLQRIVVRLGAWIDGILFETNKRKTPVFGNATGGEAHLLEAAEGTKLLGMYGSTGDWFDSLGVIYSE